MLVRTPRSLFLAIATLLCVCSTHAQILLPDLGNSASTQMSAEEEEAQGHSFYMQLKRSGYVIEDPIINRYINQLGQSLVSTQTNNEREFTFFVVNNPQINAFAMLGGYIGVNTGLILASESESELASVLAHEITHVTQQHLLRIMEKMNEQALPVSAAILAAILLGQSNSMLAEAALYSAVAKQAQTAIGYTRAHEHEADRIGIDMLAEAGFEPMAMASFFSKLEKNYRYNDNSLPEYLRTHPITSNRISDAKNRASGIEIKAVNNQDSFIFTRSRINVSTLLKNSEFIDYWEKEYQKNPQLEPGDLYALALAYIADSQYKNALHISKTLLQQYPHNMAIIETHAHLLHILSQHKDAQTLLKKGLELYPFNNALTLALSKQYIETNQLKEARKLLSTLVEQTSSLEGYQLLSKVESDAGNEGYSHFYLALYYQKQKEYPLAMTQLRYARENTGNDFYLSSRVNDLMDTISPHIEKISQQTKRKKP